MAMAMYSKALPNHSGGLRSSPFAGNSVPRSQRSPSRPPAVFSSLVCARSSMATHCSDEGCTAICSTNSVRPTIYSGEYAECFDYHPSVE